MTYVDTLNFGFIGCRDTLPSLQRLAVYSREALEELEAALGVIVVNTRERANAVGAEEFVLVEHEF